MFRAIVFAAALAGLISGLVVAAVQQIGAVPLIARGETYEKAAEPHGAAEAHAGGVPHAHGGPVAAATWEPQDGLERNGYTILFDVVERIGWGLALAGALVATGRPAGWREGLLWGLGGFVATVLAPSLGLPPELPGIPAAPIGERQLWWIATTACTGAGLWLLAFRRSAIASAIAVVLLAAPHLVGAPELDHVATAVPATLSHRFVTVVLLTTLLAWSLLGALTGFFLARFAEAPESEPGPARARA